MRQAKWSSEKRSKMHEDYIQRRKRHFSENWLTWLSLYHFLPASMVRELAYVIVDRMSNNTLSLDQLFDEVTADGPSCLDSWLLRPIEMQSPLANYLQSLIRALVWQNDQWGMTDPGKSDTTTSTISPLILGKAMELGSTDLMSAEHLLNDIPDTVQSSFTKFTEALKIARLSLTASDTADLLSGIESHILSIEMPLIAVVFKHLGDLFADVDAWDKAQILYERADRYLANNADNIDPSWQDFVASLKVIITQSKAAALNTLYGTSKAADLLSGALNKANLHDTPLMLANASFDAWAAAMKTSVEKWPPDYRSLMLLPPLLHKTHDTSDALESWLKGEFNDAHRQFWAVLRRQIALGSATETRSTKALYARSILDDLDQKLSSGQSQPLSFRMAMGLLLESGNSKSVTRIRWNEQIVDMYINQECVDFVIAHANTHEGSQRERSSVTIELFREWAERISPARADLAISMLRHITALAREPVSFYEESTLGGRSLKALQSIAEKRPELRHSIVSEIAVAVTEKIHSKRFWRNAEEALKTALVYLDAFPVESLHTVIRSTLSMLDEISPKAGFWPLVRPALNLLVAEPVKQLSASNPELGRRIVSTILRFGLQQETEHARLLFYLRDFDAALLRDSDVRDKLQETMKQIRQKAIGINSSNVVEHILALLLAPAISSGDGIKVALDGLTSIIASAKTKRPSIVLPIAYDPLLLLADSQERIANDISVDPDTFKLWLQPLIPLIVDLWAEAINRPLIFAPFSIPPATKPDSIIIHNWAFASFRFAESLGREKEVQAAISIAAANPELSKGIALARATRSASGKDDDLDTDSIRSENRDTFFAALGRRLVLLQKLDAEPGRELCKALIDQCLNLGPREIDSAVFLSAIRLNLGEYITQSYLSDYMKRLGNNRDLRLTLAPILQIFKESMD
jgi:hypothetical protein